jgi:hypothetical protein
LKRPDTVVQFSFVARPSLKDALVRRLLRPSPIRPICVAEAQTRKPSGSRGATPTSVPKKIALEEAARRQPNPHIASAERTLVSRLVPFWELSDI